MTRLLDVAVDPAVAAGLRPQVAALRVAARCTCGCPSVIFETQSGTGAVRRHMVADAYGITPEGYAVGLLLWQVAGRLEYLETYTLGHWPPYGLPAPATVTVGHPPAPPVV